MKLKTTQTTKICSCWLGPFLFLSLLLIASQTPVQCRQQRQSGAPPSSDGAETALFRPQPQNQPAVDAVNSQQQPPQLQEQSDAAVVQTASAGGFNPQQQQQQQPQPQPQPTFPAATNRQQQSAAQNGAPPFLQQNNGEQSLN